MPTTMDLMTRTGARRLRLRFPRLLCVLPCRFWSREFAHQQPEQERGIELHALRRYTFVRFLLVDIGVHGRRHGRAVRQRSVPRLGH